MNTEPTVGHINLAETINGAGEHFVHLVESLQRHGLRQYVVLRNIELAKRLDIVDGVTVGPCVRSAMMAYALMPQVDVIHLHDRSSWRAGLLLFLVRSIPFVLTDTASNGASENTVMLAVRQRAAAIIDANVADTATCIRHYREAASPQGVPTLLL